MSSPSFNLLNKFSLINLLIEHHQIHQMDGDLLQLLFHSQYNLHIQNPLHKIPKLFTRKQLTNLWLFIQILIKDLHPRLKLTLEEIKDNFNKGSLCKGLGTKIKKNFRGKDKQDRMLLSSNNNNSLLILWDDYLILDLHLFLLKLELHKINGEIDIVAYLPIFIKLYFSIKKSLF